MVYFFWGTFRVLAAGIGIAFAQKGSILGPLLFLLIYNIPNLLVRVFGMKYGYKLGAKSIDTLISGGLMAQATKAATVLGLVVIGGMISSMVYFDLGFGYRTQPAFSAVRGANALSVRPCTDIAVL